MKSLMRRNVTLAACALFLSHDGFANLGDTKEEVSERYGQPVKQAALSPYEVNNYKFGDLEVEVVFEGGKSVEEFFQPAKNKKLANDECVALLESATGCNGWVGGGGFDDDTDWQCPGDLRAAKMNIDGKTTVVVATRKFLNHYNELAVQTEKIEFLRIAHRVPTPKALAAAAERAKEGGPAKLGQDREHMEARYGRPYHETKLNGMEALLYDYGEFDVVVIYLGGKSVAQSFRPRADERKLGDRECLELAGAMTGVADWKRQFPPLLFQTRWDSGNRYMALRQGGFSEAESLAVVTFAFGHANQAAGDSAKKSSSDAAMSIFKFHLTRARAGNDGSQLRLGQLYLEGKGCEINTNEARIWLQKAADQGNEEARWVLQGLR